MRLQNRNLLPEKCIISWDANSTQPNRTRFHMRSVALCELVVTQKHNITVCVVIKNYKLIIFLNKRQRNCSSHITTELGNV